MTTPAIARDAANAWQTEFDQAWQAVYAMMPEAAMDLAVEA